MKMKRSVVLGVSLTVLASVASAKNARRCYTGQVGFNTVDPSDRFVCGHGSGGQMKSESCSTGICGQYKYEDEQCVYMVGFCSNATTVIECEDNIRLEREDEDAPAAILARRLRSQQSGQAMRRVACCDSTDCNAKDLSPKSTRKLFADRSNRKLLARRRLKKKSSSYKYKSYKKYKSKDYGYKSKDYKYKSGDGYVVYGGSGGGVGGMVGGIISSIVVAIIIIVIIIKYCARKRMQAANITNHQPVMMTVQQVEMTTQEEQSAVKVQAMHRGDKEGAEYAERVNNAQMYPGSAQPVVVSGTPVPAQVAVANAQPVTTAAVVQPVVAQPVVAQPVVAQPVVAQPAGVHPVVLQPTL